MDDSISTSEPAPSAATPSSPLTAPAPATASPAAASAAPRGLARRGLRSLPQARSLATWLLLVRPHALLFAVSPVVIGVLVIFAAGRHVVWGLGLAAVLAVGLAQAGVGALDAYAEHRRSLQAAAQGTRGAGSPSTVVARGIYPLEALRAGCVLLALGMLAGLPLVARGGPLFAALALLGTALAVA
ncbi:MAG TPA: hypothetical protein VFY89_03635, partial [Ktedonobacterales bacterium]